MPSEVWSPNNSKEKHERINALVKVCHQNKSALNAAAIASWKEEITALSENAKKLHELIDSGAISVQQNCLAIIWVRLFVRAGITIHTEAWLNYLGWKYANERRSILLYSCENHENISIQIAVRGVPKFGNILGFCAEELLAADDIAFGGCPSKLGWTIERHAIDAKTMQLTGKKRPLLEKFSLAQKNKISPQLKRSYTESNGTGLTSILLEALEKHALSAGLIHEQNPDEEKRKFVSDSQTAEKLQVFLLKKDKRLTEYAKTNIIVAIRRLVSLSRGRPKKSTIKR